LTQQLTRPPEQVPEFIPPPPEQEPRFFKPSIISLLALLGLLLLVFTGLIVRSLPAAVHPPVPPGVTPTSTSITQPLSAAIMLQVPGTGSPAPLTVPTGHDVIYEQQNNIYVISASTGAARVLSTPGYIYNRSITPLLTPTGQLLYSGNGLWLSDVSSGSARQIAALPAKQVITSMKLSSDGKTVAWSTEPLSDNGNVTIYAGPLEQSRPIYSHSINACPCFRVFSFMNDKPGHNTLLLTDDRGDHRSIQYGLWSLDLSQKSGQKLHQLMSGVQPAGPLTVAPDSHMLLYSTYEGFVPLPTDGSVPQGASSLNYANSLSILTSGSNVPTASSLHVVLPVQHELSNTAAYHWVTTPLFSPDEHTLLYVEFSSDASEPYTRHSALYMVHISGSGSHLVIGKPQVLMTTTAHFMELGAWLNSHIVTLYADSNLYAVDTTTSTATVLANVQATAKLVTPTLVANTIGIPGYYARIAAVTSQR
jgi:hypothetical protein